MWWNSDDTSGMTTWDAVRGDLALLRGSDGDFAVATEECLGSRLAEAGLDYSENPLPGNAFWFLVRKVTALQPGTYDTAEPSQVQPRDSGINASPQGCP